jgi:hypothetical protein
MQSTNTSRDDGFRPKYHHFSPLSRIWVQNPFDHDVVYQVADEYNRPYKYRLPAGKVSELPGGAIATLGVKAIVDELISNSKEDQMLMWDPLVRGRHEADIIMRIKETAPSAADVATGEIDLSVKGNDQPEPTATVTEAPEESAFDSLNNEPVGEAIDTPQLAPLPPEASQGLEDLVSASLPKEDKVLEG